MRSHPCYNMSQLGRDQHKLGSKTGFMEPF